MLARTSAATQLRPLTYALALQNTDKEIHMNILHTECSMNWGGQEYRTLLEHDYLNSNNHKSWIMCHPESALFDRGKRAGSLNIIPMDFSKAYNLGVAFKVHFFCRKNQIDVINTHGSKDSTLSLISFLFGIPLFRSRQITSEIKKGFSYQYLATHIIAAAEAIKRILVAKNVNENKITVIGEGVDLRRYNPDLDSEDVKNEFGVTNSDVVIVNIGMIRSDKGQKHYIEAAQEVLKSHVNTKFFLIGEGAGNRELEHELRGKVELQGLGENVIFTGYRDDVERFIHMADIVVVASTGVEAQSRIVPQAFATRRTVVSTDTGGLTELVNHEENGLVVPAGSSIAISEAIKRLIDDVGLRRKMANKAYEKAVNDLAFDKMMDKTLHLYRSSIESRMR